MSYKLLMEIIQYENHIDNYSYDERMIIEADHKDRIAAAMNNIGKPKL